jgi:hypothetical protein
VTLTTQDIPRSQWRSYFDEFSRDLEPMRARVEIIGRTLGAQVQADRPLLAGISYDDRDDIIVIGLDPPEGGAEEFEHIVYQPHKVSVASGEGSKVVFDIEDAEGIRTLISLEPAT